MKRVLSLFLLFFMSSTASFTAEKWTEREKKMKALKTLQIVVEHQKKLIKQSLRLGISVSKQQGLNEYLGKLGLGGDIGEAIQSNFAFGLRRGQFTDLIKGGYIAGSDIADLLQSLMAYMSEMNVREQSDFLIQRGFSTEIANAIFRSRDYTEKDKYAKLVNTPITTENEEQDKNNFIIDKFINNIEIEKDGISLKKNLNISEMKAYKKSEIGQFEEEVKNTTIGKLDEEVKNITTDAVKKSVKTEKKAKELDGKLEQGRQRFADARSDMIEFH